MHSNKLSHSAVLNKWQTMQTLVNQQPYVQPLSERKLFYTRLFAENLLAFLLQAMGLAISTVNEPMCIVWLASGTAFGFTLMRGYSILPGIAFGSFFAYLIAGANSNLAFIAASIYSVQAFLLVYCCHKLQIATLIFYRVKMFIRFIICVGIVSAFSSFLLVKLSFPAPLLNLWLSWWLANFNGLLIFAAGLITLDGFFPQMPNLKTFAKLPLISLFTLLNVLLLCVIFSQQPAAILLLSITITLLSLSISYLFQWPGAMAAVFCVGSVLTLGQFLAAPLFHTSTLNIFFWQVLLFLTTILTLSVALIKKHALF